VRTDHLLPRHVALPGRPWAPLEQMSPRCGRPCLAGYVSKQFGRSRNSRRRSPCWRRRRHLGNSSRKANGSGGARQVHLEGAQAGRPARPTRTRTGESRRRTPKQRRRRKPTRASRSANAGTRGPSEQPRQLNRQRQPRQRRQRREAAKAKAETAEAAKAAEAAKTAQPMQLRQRPRQPRRPTVVGSSYRRPGSALQSGLPRPRRNASGWPSPSHASARRPFPAMRSARSSSSSFYSGT
jgi:hypothetical protein